MDLRGQQIVVQQHMNDRLAEARMARLACESRAPGRGFEQESTPVVQRARHAHGQGLLGGFLASVVEAAGTVGATLAPTPPIHVRVARR